MFDLMTRLGGSDGGSNPSRKRKVTGSTPAPTTTRWPASGWSSAASARVQRPAVATRCQAATAAAPGARARSGHGPHSTPGGSAVTLPQLEHERHDGARSTESAGQGRIEQEDADERHTDDDRQAEPVGGGAAPAVTGGERNLHADHHIGAKVPGQSLNNHLRAVAQPQ